MFISEINVFPVKSLRGTGRETALVERRGLANDRRWMIVDVENRFLSQREFPKMARITTDLTDAGLILGFEGKRIRAPFAAADSKRETVAVWNDRCPAEVAGVEINEWLSDILEARCRLVRMPDDSVRPVDAAYAIRADDRVSFADGFPFLLIGESSLGDLNSRLETPVPMDRFRPNLVVSGAEAFAEDDWKRIRIGETVFHVVKPCSRCVITTIDQAEGVKTGVEPLRTLAEFRTFERNGAKKILFGQNLIAENVGGSLRVGDRVEVVE